jgi:hypothetical protein
MAGFKPIEIPVTIKLKIDKGPFDDIRSEKIFTFDDMRRAWDEGYMRRVLFPNQVSAGDNPYTKATSAPAAAKPTRVEASIDQINKALDDMLNKSRGGASCRRPNQPSLEAVMGEINKTLDETLSKARNRNGPPPSEASRENGAS